jgi:hypothetical protein
VAIVKKAADSGSWPLATSQATAKEQLSAALDGLRQLIGAANIASGSTESTDPLTAPFVLYVNPYIGRDTFASGSYNTREVTGTTEQIVAQKLKRLENQRLTCGYTRHAPFKTINRAVIEAAIITSKNWYINDPLAHVDCVCIVLAPGLHTAYNNPASEGSTVTAWTDGLEPTASQLIGFNPAEGGILLPRGASIVSEFGDLRHTIIRPDYVPSGDVDETPTYASGVATYALRRQIFKTTGGGYAYGLTLMDKLSLASTHHLLAGFGHATKAELDAFYAKVFTACGTGGNLSQALLAARGTEYTIAAPVSGTPTQAWDSTASASFYIFQCSVRSNYGMGRLWIDGAKVDGFKSFVMANYTGVSLQKGISEQGDMRCWQKYSGGSWVAVSSYADYIAQTPDNIRMHPARRSVGVGAINEGFVQKVSIFDIGEGAQSFVDTGGEIDSNNGNSSFGGVAGLAKGYRKASFPSDKSWQISAVRAPLSVQAKTGNVQRVYLGTISAITSTTITLSTALAPYESSASVPSPVGERGYTLPSASYLWIENPQGTDWRALSTASTWSSTVPAVLNITAAATDPSGLAIGNGGNGISLAIGCRVYIRRLTDTRTPAERRLSFKLSNTTTARIPSASYVLQTNTASATISRELSSTELLLVTSTGVGDALSAGVLKTAEVTLRRGGTAVNYANATTYKAGTVVLYANKHYINSKELTTANAVPDPTLWQETYVHMESTYAPEDNLNNEAPIIIFDLDTDGAFDTTTCGINWSTVWTASAAIYNQYRAGTDYLGAFLFLTALGYAATDAHNALIPRLEASRNRNPALATSPSSTLALSNVAPTGGAAVSATNWPVEFRRPSTLWMGAHRWFGSGLGNYSKAVPAAAQDMSAQNKFTYYFTSQGGGRVIPQGAQEDGLLVSPRGLEDTTTGQTLTVENIGAGDINTSQTDTVTNLTVTSALTVSGAATFSGLTNFNVSQTSTTTKLGPNTLATLSALTTTGSSAVVATTDSQINGAPGAVTVPGLNAWRNANQLVSALTGEIYIYVNSTATDRNLNSMKTTPPTSPGSAVVSLGRAAEYANYALAGSEQTAIIRVAPGYYIGASSWTCNVRFEAWNNTFTAMPYPSNSLGTDTIPNNYYDGKGYDDPTLIPQIIGWRLFLRDGVTSGTTSGQTNLHMCCYPNPMYFSKSLEFVGGFAFLGLAEMLKYIAGNTTDRAPQFISSLGTDWGTASQVRALTYSTNTATNVDQFLNSVRTSAGRLGSFASWAEAPIIYISSRVSDVAKLNDCIFGPGLPMHKEALGGPRCAYIEIRAEVQIETRNIYLRGNTIITSAGIGTSGPIDSSNAYHYGTTLATAPWTWRQFYHTFIGSNGANKLNFKMIGTNTHAVGKTDAGTVFAGANLDWYRDLTGKLLPNHIHLLTNSTTATAPNSFTSSTLAYPASTPTVDYDNGPFLDQFIHAKTGIVIDACFINIAGYNSLRPVWQGFLGRFGSNGHNTTRTRGIMIGNMYTDPEGGAEVMIGVYQSVRSMFIKAGVIDVYSTTAVPPYVLGAASYGEANPAGDNPVITTRDNGSTTVDLNLGLRTWRAGISPQYGSNIRPRSIIL